MDSSPLQKSLLSRRLVGTKLPLRMESRWILARVRICLTEPRDCYYIKWALAYDFLLGTIQGPTEYLGTSRNGTKLPPPRARSPIKTNIGSTPRRSLGPLSSPTRLSNGATPTQSISKTNFSQNSNPIVTPGADGSIRKSRKPPPKSVEQVAKSSKGKKRAFDLTRADETDDDERVESGANGDIDLTQPGLDLGGDDGVNGDAGLDDDGGENRDVDENRDNDDNGDVDERADSPAPAVEEDQEAEKPPAKRRKGGKRLLSKQEGSKKMKPPKPKPKPAANSAVKRTAPKFKPTQQGEAIPRARSLFAIRSETPADDSGAIRLKSGRTSIKPLAYWKGERVLLGEGRVDGKVHILPSIKEVVRIDEIEFSKPKRRANKGFRSKARKSRKAEEGEEEEVDDDEREAWELETGIMNAQVMAWDPVIGKYDEEALEETGTCFLLSFSIIGDSTVVTWSIKKSPTQPKR